MSIVRLACKYVLTVESNRQDHDESAESERKRLLVAEFFTCRTQSRKSTARYAAALASDRLADIVTCGDAAALDAARLATLARLLRSQR